MYDGKQVPAWLETAISADAHHGSRTTSCSSEPGDAVKALTPASTPAEKHESGHPIPSMYEDNVDPTISDQAGQEYGPEVLSW